MKILKFGVVILAVAAVFFGALAQSRRNPRIPPSPAMDQGVAAVETWSPGMTRTAAGCTMR